MALLQKRPIILRSLLIVARHITHCTVLQCHSAATISRLLRIIGLFCKRALQKRLYSAEENYNFKEPTNRSHLTHCSVLQCHGAATLSLAPYTRYFHISWRVCVCVYTLTYISGVCLCVYICKHMYVYTQ